MNKVCALEGAEDGVLFSSGMAAMSTSILAFAGSGDHVVMMDELYGGTHAFATDEFDRLGIAYTFAATNAESICSATTESTTVIVIESPTNPFLGVIDIRKVAQFARDRGITTVMDNTFATPVNQNPLELGIDVVVHSGTKYLGGHSDLCCGVAVTSAVQREAGACAGKAPGRKPRRDGMLSARTKFKDSGFENRSSVRKCSESFGGPAATSSSNTGELSRPTWFPGARTRQVTNESIRRHAFVRGR